jgi:hypothetical protein
MLDKNKRIPHQPCSYCEGFALHKIWCMEVNENTLQAWHFASGVLTKFDESFLKAARISI